MEFIPYQLALFITAGLCSLVPGPTALTTINICSTQNAKAGITFVSGALFGIGTWFTFTAASLIEADRLPETIFTLLTITCALYLLFLGYQFFRKSAKDNHGATFTRPFRSGLLISALNPKSYPVMLALFSGVAIQYPGLMEWKNFSQIFIFAASGFIAGYAIIITIANLKMFKNFYTKHIRALSMLFGAVFCWFGLSLLLSLELF